MWVAVQQKTTLVRATIQTHHHLPHRLLGRHLRLQHHLVLLPHRLIELLLHRQVGLHKLLQCMPCTTRGGCRRRRRRRLQDAPQKCRHPGRPPRQRCLSARGAFAAHCEGRLQAAEAERVVIAWARRGVGQRHHADCAVRGRHPGTAVESAYGNRMMCDHRGAARGLKHTAVMHSGGTHTAHTAAAVNVSEGKTGRAPLFQIDRKNCTGSCVCKGRDGCRRCGNVTQPCRVDSNVHVACGLRSSYARVLTCELGGGVPRRRKEGS